MVAKKAHKKTDEEDRLLTHRVTVLRRHMVDCRVCAGAVRAGQWGAFCDKGVETSAKVALAFNIMLELKKTAGPDHNGLVYACPDTAAHGQAYALTAQLFNVNGMQEMLF